MTDPLLNYRPPPPVNRTGVFIAAWIYMLTLGIIYTSLGSCLGVSLVLYFGLLMKASRNPQTTAIGSCIIIATLVLSGIVYLASALRLRKRKSRAAAIAGIVVAAVNVAASVGMSSLATFRALQHTTTARSSLISAAFYAGLAITNGILAFLLLRVRASLARQSTDLIAPA